MTPAILEGQAKGMIGAAWLNTKLQKQDIPLGNYVVNVDLRRNRRNPAEVPALGYALVICTGPNEYLVAGYDVQVTFTPSTPGPFSKASPSATAACSRAWRRSAIARSIFCFSSGISRKPARACASA